MSPNEVPASLEYEIPVVGTRWISKEPYPGGDHAEGMVELVTNPFHSLINGELYGPSVIFRGKDSFNLGLLCTYPVEVFLAAYEPAPVTQRLVVYNQQFQGEAQ